MNMPKPTEANRDDLWPLLIVLIGLVLRATAIAAFGHTPAGDELAYKSMALSLIGGNKMVDNMGNYAMYNMGYPTFILAPVFYFFGDNLLAARLMNVILGGVAIALCYMVAREAGAGRIGGLLASAIWAVYLPASVYGVYLLKENVMVPLMLGVTWCALRLTVAPSARIALACGALFGLLSLTGNAALSLGGAVIFALALAPTSAKRKLVLSVLILLTTTGIATPWIVRNMQTIGAPVMNTNGGFNLYIGNNPAATGWFVSISDTPRGPTWEALRKSGEALASETLKRDAIDWIKMHPTEFLDLAVKKAIYFWTPPFHEGKGESSTVERVVRIMWAMQFFVLLGAALGSLTFARLRNRRIAVLWVGIACYTAVHMLFYVIFRYRLPIMPLVGVIAAIAVEAVVTKGPSTMSQGTASARSTVE